MSKLALLARIGLISVLLVAPIGVAFGIGQSESPDESQEITLQIWGWGNPLRIDPAVEAYAEIAPDVNFEVSVFPFGDYWTKLAAAVPAGTGPDLFLIHTRFTHEYASAGLLSEMPEDLFPQSFVDQFKNPDMYGYVGGKRYLLPWAEQNGVLFYNKEMAADAGYSLSPDEVLTWEELREIAQDLAVTDGEGRITRAGFTMSGNLDWLFQIMMLQRGMHWIGSDGEELLYDTPEGLETLRFLYSFYERGIDLRDLPDIVQSFGSELTAMMVSNGFARQNVLANYPEMADKIGFLPMPTWTGEQTPAQTTGNQLLSPVVPTGLDEETTRAAFEFVKFYLSDDNLLRELLAFGAQAPTRIDMADEFARDNELIQIMNMQSPYSIASIQPGWLREVSTRYLHDGLLYADMTPEEAMEQFVAEARQRMAEEPLEEWYYTLDYYSYSDMLE